LLPAAVAWFCHRADGQRRLGLADPAADGVRLLDLGPVDELELLAGGALDGRRLEEQRGRARPLAEPITWQVPVARPSKILCLGKNFAAHAAEFGAAVPDEPLFFTKLVDTLLPHQGDVLLPHWLDTRIDHEIELGVVLGFADPQRLGRKYVTPDDALDLVAGYTILDDVTARGMQGDDRGERKPWLRCKSFDTFCPIGPWVVPSSALDVGDLAIALTVNGEPRQASRTSLMVVDVPHALAYLSRHTTLRPGDIIAMGTPAGVGPLLDGDRVSGTIEGIGELRHGVVREPRPR